MATLRKGYAVGGDSTEWKRYITERINELEADILKSKPRFNAAIDTCPTTLNQKKTKNDLKSFQDTVGKMIDSTII